jgi:signal peptidase I
MRIGEGTLGMVTGAIPLAALILGCIACAVVPGVIGPDAAMLGIGAIVLAAMVASAASSWRFSAVARRPAEWWSRWYSLAPLWVAAVFAAAIAPNPYGYPKLFYVPGEGMAPSLAKNDRFVARMGPAVGIGRGDVVVVDGPAGARHVQRVAALAGDRVALVDGVVILNGRRVPQRLVRAERTMRRLAERLPGEAGEHEILDSAAGPFDDFPETVVRPGHVFLLGDNRDESADSRVPRDRMGLGQVPLADVSGRFLFELEGLPAGIRW